MKHHRSISTKRRRPTIRFTLIMHNHYYCYHHHHHHHHHHDHHDHYNHDRMIVNLLLLRYHQSRPLIDPTPPYNHLDFLHSLVSHFQIVSQTSNEH